MKKLYSLLLMMLVCMAFSTTRASVQVDALGEALTSLSEVKEGDYLAFEATTGNYAGKFLYNRKYNKSATEYAWQLNFHKGDFLSAIGKSESEQYVWKVVDMNASNGTIQCKLQNHVGTYVPLLDNDNDGGSNWCSEDATVLTIAAGATEGTWTVKDAKGKYMGVHNWGHAIGDGSASEFKIYEPTVSEGKATVEIKIEAADEDGNQVAAYDRTYQLAIGETFTVHSTGWGWTFVSFYDENYEKSYNEGDVIEVTGAATYYMTVRPWPTITFRYVDNDGIAILNKGTDVPAEYSSQYEPGSTIWSVGGVYGYYAPKSEQDKYVGKEVTDDMDGDIYDVILEPAPFLTLTCVDENNNVLETDAKPDYAQPGQSIYVPNIAWYTLNKEDSIYVYNYETNEGYLVPETSEEIYITLHYTSETLPFQATTLVEGALAADTKWYTMRFAGSLYMNSEMNLAEKADFDDNEASAVADEYQWAFVGDVKTGYAIYNKATGKALGLEKVEDGMAPTMSEVATLFLLRKNMSGDYSLAVEGKNTYGMDIDLCLNNFGQAGVAKLYGGMWGGTNDPNACIEFFPVSDVETSIDDITVAPAAEVPLYDLQGRRVLSPIQGGIYIQGGKAVVK